MVLGIEHTSLRICNIAVLNFSLNSTVIPADTICGILAIKDLSLRCESSHKAVSTGVSEEVAEILSPHHCWRIDKLPAFGRSAATIVDEGAVHEIAC